MMEVGISTEAFTWHLQQNPLDSRGEGAANFGSEGCDTDTLIRYLRRGVKREELQMETPERVAYIIGTACSRSAVNIC